MKKVFALLALFSLYTSQCDHHEHDHDHDCDHPAHDDCDHPDHNHGNNKDENQNHEDHQQKTEFGHEQFLGMFQTYDTDGDKKLSRDQVIKGAASQLKDQSLIGYVEKTLDPIIAKHDNEGDGLDVEQFLKMAREATQGDL